MKTSDLLAAAAGALLLASCSHKKAETAEAALPVDVAFPQIDSLVLHNDYPGYIAATSQTDVVARVNGQIVKQLYDDGAYVKAGQPLFAIESTTYADKVNAAEASLQTALATNEYNQKQYEAMKKALLSDAVSKMDVNQAESNLRESEAAIKTARAELQTARTMLGYCTVRAPFDGRATASYLTAGDYVSGEASPVTVCRIYNDAEVFVKFSIEEPQYIELTQTRQGKEVDFKHIPVILNDTVSPVFFGYLDYEAPDVDRSTGTVNLRMVVQNPDHSLKNGMFATVRLPYAVNPHAVVISDAAIGTDQLGKYAYLVNDSDRIAYTPIKTGELYQDTLRIVTSGIGPDDRYVTKALIKVRDGMPVKPSLPARGTVKTAAAR